MKCYLYFKHSPQYPPQGSRIANLFGLYDSSCWGMVIFTWLTVWYIFKLLEYIADRMGYISLEEEIPFCPFRWFYHISNFHYSTCNQSFLSRVNVPMGGVIQNYTNLNMRRMFGYANVRKASYRGSMAHSYILIILSINIIPISVQVLCDWRNISALVCWLRAVHNNA